MKQNLTWILKGKERDVLSARACGRAFGSPTSPYHGGHQISPGWGKGFSLRIIGPSNGRSLNLYSRGLVPQNSQFWGGLVIYNHEIYKGSFCYQYCRFQSQWRDDWWLGWMPITPMSSNDLVSKAQGKTYFKHHWNSDTKPVKNILARLVPIGYHLLVLGTLTGIGSCSAWLAN